MKSPDAVKKGLRCLSHDRTHTLPCSGCEYHGQGLPPCRTAVHEDALALIQQLEAQNAEKDERIQQLEKRVIHLEALNQSNLSVITMQERTRDRLQEQISQLEAERDAAVETIYEMAKCITEDVCEWCDGVECERMCMQHTILRPGFKWRGVQKEETP